MHLPKWCGVKHPVQQKLHDVAPTLERPLNLGKSDRGPGFWVDWPTWNLP